MTDSFISIATKVPNLLHDPLKLTRIRGDHCRTAARLYEEFASSVPFPEYFGRNWSAFNECLSEVDFKPVPPRWTIVIESGSSVLDLDPLERASLYRSLECAHSTYARPVQEGELWDRPAIEFSVSFLVGADVSLGEMLQDWVLRGWAHIVP